MVFSDELSGTNKKTTLIFYHYQRVEYDISVTYRINQENDHTAHQ